MLNIPRAALEKRGILKEKKKKKDFGPKNLTKIPSKKHLREERSYKKKNGLFVYGLKYTPPQRKKKKAPPPKKE